ncbi:S1 RNA-binding domain-containing protein [Arthrobacter sp. SA17]
MGKASRRSNDARANPRPRRLRGFVTLENGIVGLIHNSQLPSTMRRPDGKGLRIGERVIVRIMRCNPNANELP